MSNRRATRPKPKPKKKQSSGRGPGRPSNGAQNVAQIRELIFGEQMMGYEQRFAALEAKLNAEVGALKKAVEAQLSEVKDLVASRATDLESRCVPRKQIAASLERLAKTLRG